MARSTMLVLTLILTVLHAGKLSADDTENAQEESAARAAFSAMVQAVVTAAAPLMGEEEEDDGGDRLPAAPPTPDEDVCHLGDGGCPPGDEEAPFPPVEAPLDALVDFGLAFALQKHALLRGDRLPMEDLGKGRLRLTNGTIGALRNFERREPVALRRALVEGKRALLVAFTGGFHFVDIRYRYQYNIPLLSQAGHVQGSLSPVEILVEVLLRLPCRAHLLALNVTRAGDLRLNGSGFWPLNGVVFGLLRDLADGTARAALHRAVDDARRQLQAQLDAVHC